MPILPPGIDAGAFQSAIREFEGIVGQEWVFTSDQALHSYRDHFSYFKDQPEELIPSAAVGPDSTEQVQAIVRTANKYGIPLYAISTGKNFAYGGPAPNLRGSVTVDLKRMDRVLEVDDKRYYALVEPGVSYMDLYRYIQERGLKVWVDTPEPGWGGLVGNALDHGVGYTMGNYRDHFNAHCGMEVVLPNGELLRTGMGALPASDCWQEFRHGFGPDPSGLFGQGNFGIVTKMGFRLMPQPDHWRTGIVTVPKRRDFIPLVEVVNYLTDLSIIGEPSYGSLLDVLARDDDFRKAAMALDEDAMDRQAAAAGLHSWQVELQFYGSEKTTLANWEYAKELFSRRLPGARFIDGDSLSVPLSEEQIEATNRPLASPYRPAIRRNLAHGVPNLAVWKRMGRSERNPGRWNEQHIALWSVVGRSGEAVLQAQKDFTDIAQRLKLPPIFLNAIMPPVNWFQSSFLMGSGFGIGAGHDSPEGKRRTMQRFRDLLAENAKAGYGDYRAPPTLQDDVAAQYSFNNHVLRRFNESLKDAVDPNGILMPGRGGIWPAAYRSQRGGSG